MNVWIYITFVLLVFVHTARANAKGELEQEILKSLLANYDKRIMPAKYGHVYVQVGTYVRSLIELDADRNLYTIQLSFRQQWYDGRFHFQSKYGPDFFIRPNLHKIWIPDLFLQDSMKGSVHRILTPYTEVRIYPNAQVYCSSRVSIDVYWPMDLTNFPLDRQVFEIEIVTHERTARDIVIEWRDAIQISKMLHFPPYTVSSMGAYPCTSKTNASDEDSCKKMMIYFTREFTYYLLRAFIPSICLVISSWIPFWLHPRSAPPRLGMAIVVLGIFVVLAVAESGPRVFYMKAMDIWMGFCFCFIFCAFIEVVIANSSISAVDKKKKKKPPQDVEEKGANRKRADSLLPPKYTCIPLRKPSVKKYSTHAQKIDVVSRFLFPISFAFFNLVFWLFYTSK